MTKKSVPPSQSNPLGSFNLEDKHSQIFDNDDSYENSEEEEEEEEEQMEQTDNSISTMTSHNAIPPPPSKQEEDEEDAHIKEETINVSTLSLLEKKLEQIRASTPKKVAHVIEESSSEREEEDEAMDSYELLEQNLKSLQRRKIETKKEFLLESFNIFKKIHDMTRKKKACQKRQLIYSEDEQPDVDRMFQQYLELAANFDETEKTEPIWDLTQRLYFSSNTDGSLHIVRQLKAWYDMYYPFDGINDLAQQEIATVYTYARKHLLRGDWNRAVELLQHTVKITDKEKHTYINKIIDLVQQYKSALHNLGGQDSIECNSFWSSWHQTCQLQYRNYKSSFDKEDTNVDTVDKHLLSIYGILAGVEGHLREWSHQSGRDWLDSIIATNLFARLQISVSELNSLARDIGSFRESEQAKADENNIWPVYGYLIMGMFDEALDAMGDYSWLQTHLGHALLVSGVYFTGTQPNDTAEEDLEKESRLVDPVYYSIKCYANMIAHDFDMWNEAITYLSSCSLNKELWIKQLLGSPPLPEKDSTFLESILDTADHYQLQYVKAYINQELGRRCEQSNNIREATIRYALATDIPSLDRLAQINLDRFLEEGSLQDVVTNEHYLGVKLHLETKSCYYEALLKYTKFKDELTRKKWTDAAESSASLIANTYLPKLFQAALLVDIMYILEDSQHHFTARKMREFIDLFDEVTNDPTSQAFMTRYYQRERPTQASTKDVTARIRERVSYKAATAPEKLT